MVVDKNEIKVEALGKDDKLRLDSVGLTLTIADIYENVIHIKNWKLKIKN
ncbi:hypothetical protein [Anabaena sphaerica]|nr:hypothetical protein [Anabaena sphaerica]